MDKEKLDTKTWVIGCLSWVFILGLWGICLGIMLKIALWVLNL